MLMEHFNFVFVFFFCVYDCLDVVGCPVSFSSSFSFSFFFVCFVLFLGMAFLNSTYLSLSLSVALHCITLHYDIWTLCSEHPFHHWSSKAFWRSADAEAEAERFRSEWAFV